MRFQNYHFNHLDNFGNFMQSLWDFQCPKLSAWKLSTFQLSNWYINLDDCATQCCTDQATARPFTCCRGSLKRFIKQLPLALNELRPAKLEKAWAVLSNAKRLPVTSSLSIEPCASRVAKCRLLSDAYRPATERSAQLAAWPALTSSKLPVSVYNCLTSSNQTRLAAIASAAKWRASDLLLSSLQAAGTTLKLSSWHTIGWRPSTWTLRERQSQSVHFCV